MNARTDKKVRIILSGALGRMGIAVSTLAETNNHVEIVAGVDSETPAILCKYPIFRSISECDTPADVLISFLRPTATEENTATFNYCAEKKLPIVIATTGLCEKLLTSAAEAAKKTPVLTAPNLSLGINVLINILSRYSSFLHGADFDIEITERHHSRKLDSPSGTAMKLAQTINDSLNQTMQIALNRNNVQTERSRAEIGISAVRGGGIIGEHSVIFAGANEVIELTHKAISRDVFAEGALKAADFIFNKTPGLYTLQDIFNEISTG